MANTTPSEKKEIERNRASSEKNKSAGAPWGLKVNKKQGTSDGYMMKQTYKQKVDKRDREEATRRDEINAGKERSQGRPVLKSIDRNAKKR